MTNRNLDEAALKRAAATEYQMRNCRSDSLGRKEREKTFFHHTSLRPRGALMKGVREFFSAIREMMREMMLQGQQRIKKEQPDACSRSSRECSLSSTDC